MALNRRRNEDIRPLVTALQQRFDEAELRQFAFDMLVDHEDLPGKTKTDLARELALNLPAAWAVGGIRGKGEGGTAVALTARTLGFFACRNKRIVSQFFKISNVKG